jgi:outer membrane biosynthesis protein TonB
MQKPKTSFRTWKSGKHWMYGMTCLAALSLGVQIATPIAQPLVAYANEVGEEIPPAEETPVVTPEESEPVEAPVGPSTEESVQTDTENPEQSSEVGETASEETNQSETPTEEAPIESSTEESEVPSDNGESVVEETPSNPEGTEESTTEESNSEESNVVYLDLDGFDGAISEAYNYLEWYPNKTSEAIAALNTAISQAQAMRYNFASQNAINGFGDLEDGKQPVQPLQAYTQEDVQDAENALWSAISEFSNSEDHVRLELQNVDMALSNAENALSIYPDSQSSLKWELVDMVNSAKRSVEDFHQQNINNGFEEGEKANIGAYDYTQDDVEQLASSLFMKTNEFYGYEDSHNIVKVELAGLTDVIVQAKDALSNYPNKNAASKAQLQAVLERAESTLEQLHQQNINNGFEEGEKTENSDTQLSQGVADNLVGELQWNIEEYIAADEAKPEDAVKLELDDFNKAVQDAYDTWKAHPEKSEAKQSAMHDAMMAAEGLQYAFKNQNALNGYGELENGKEPSQNFTIYTQDDVLNATTDINNAVETFLAEDEAVKEELMLDELQASIDNARDILTNTPNKADVAVAKFSGEINNAENMMKLFKAQNVANGFGLRAKRLAMRLLAAEQAQYTQEHVNALVGTLNTSTEEFKASDDVTPTTPDEKAEALKLDELKAAIDNANKALNDHPNKKGLAIVKLKSSLAESFAIHEMAVKQNEDNGFAKTRATGLTQANIDDEVSKLNADVHEYLASEDDTAKDKPSETPATPEDKPSDKPSETPSTDDKGKDDNNKSDVSKAGETNKTDNNQPQANAEASETPKANGKEAKVAPTKAEAPVETKADKANENTTLPQAGDVADAMFAQGLGVIGLAGVLAAIKRKFG